MPAILPRMNGLVWPRGKAWGVVRVVLWILVGVVLTLGWMMAQGQ